MRRLFPLLVLISLPCMAQVQVFTDQAHPVHNTLGAPIIYVDRPEQIEEAISVDLPDDPDAAARHFMVLTQSAQWEGIQASLIEGYRGLTEAWRAGITKVPAVLVDGRYVVYGEPDVGAAVERIERYRLEQGDE